MKKEFSFYEFAGILTPSVILLYFFNLILFQTYGTVLFEFSEIGESIVFLIIAYGLGQVLHSIGNIFESVIWWFFNGKPTQWLTKKPRFKQNLFDEHDTNEILSKLYKEFGEAEGKDYGRLAFTKIFTAEKTGRIDVFNGNYSLFRALSVCFLLLSLAMIWMCYDWWTLLPILFFLMSVSRMIRFAKYYAREVFRTYLTLQ